jgi:uncharacterized membrane protein
MSYYWFIFASLTVVGSLTYNVCMKLGIGSINAFSYVLLMNLFTCFAQALFFITARYGFKVDTVTGLTPYGRMLCAVAGVAVAMIDICYFFALRYGSIIASQMFWTIGGTIALVIFAVLFFKEPVTLTKAAGIVMGLASLYLMTRQT